MKITSTAMIVIAFTFAVSSTAAEDLRTLDHYALMISNVQYSGAPPITLEPRHDHILARRLAESGFHVISLENANQKQMLAAVDALAARLNREGGVAFFYFLGHTVTRDQKNFLLPTGVSFKNLDDLYRSAVSLDDVIATLERSGSQLNMVAIDGGRRLPESWTGKGSSLSLLWDSPLQLQKTYVLLRCAGWVYFITEQFTRVLSDYLPLPGKPLYALLKDVQKAALRFVGLPETPIIYRPDGESPAYLVGDEQTPTPPVGTLDVDFVKNELVVDFRGVSYKLGLGQRLRLENVPVGNYTMNLRYPDGYEAGVGVEVSAGMDGVFSIGHYESR